MSLFSAGTRDNRDSPEVWQGLSSHKQHHEDRDDACLVSIRVLVPKTVADTEQILRKTFLRATEGRSQWPMVS